jgi:predicted nucleic acid-binding protein
VPSRPLAVLDACVLINLLATGRAEEILSGSDHAFAICSVVRNESIYLRAADPSAPPEEVKLDGLVESGCLKVLGLSGNPEDALYIDYAGQLDDGEAMSLALAQSRGLFMATDDRKARRLFTEEVEDSRRLLSTAGILRSWSEKVGLERVELKKMLLDVSRRGRFFPQSGDPNFTWWSDAIV